MEKGRQGCKNEKPLGPLAGENLLKKKGRKQKKRERSRDPHGVTEKTQHCGKKVRRGGTHKRGEPTNIFCGGSTHENVGAEHREQQKKRKVEFPSTDHVRRWNDKPPRVRWTESKKKLRESKDAGPEKERFEMKGRGGRWQRMVWVLSTGEGGGTRPSPMTQGVRSKKDVENNVGKRLGQRVEGRTGPGHTRHGGERLEGVGGCRKILYRKNPARAETVGKAILSSVLGGRTESQGNRS